MFPFLSSSPCASCPPPHVLPVLLHVLPVLLHVLPVWLLVKALRLPVVGSQVVGLLPLKALLDAADFYIQRDQLFILEEEHKVRLVSL